MPVIIDGTSGITSPGGDTNTSSTSSSFVSIGSQKLGAGNSTRFKNRIINGDMRIDQRNGGASVTPSSGTSSYVLDRYQCVYSQPSKFSVQQNAGSVTPPTGFINYMGITSLSAYSNSGEIFSVQQRIEGLNVQDLGWGTANAKPVTLSLWVYSSLTGTFGGSIANSAQNRSYPFTYIVSSANIWTQVNVTISGDTSGTWLTTNGVGIILNFNLGSGSTWAGTSGAWAGADYRTATGANSIIGTNGATFYITGVQLEVGSSATSFEYVDYTTQLAMCQRYYETGYYRWRGFDNGFTFVGTNFFAVNKRTAPTITNGGAGAASIFTGSFMVTGSGGNFDTGNVLYTASAEL